MYTRRHLHCVMRTGLHLRPDRNPCNKRRCPLTDTPKPLPTRHYDTSTRARGSETTEAFNGLFWTSDKPIPRHVERQSSDWSASGKCGLWQSEASAFVAEKQQSQICEHYEEHESSVVCDTPAAILHTEHVLLRESHLVCQPPLRFVFK